ncbi:hypothetical protein J4429_02540 [Candidatus Pacearchaeota archaeon]|nr:hypothetical protein [Candidatus Pacearchaeota archaeon]
METQTIDSISREVMLLKKEFAKMKEFITDDLEFAKRTEEAWQEIDEGKCTRMDSEDFLKEIKKW